MLGRNFHDAIFFYALPSRVIPTKPLSVASSNLQQCAVWQICISTSSSCAQSTLHEETTIWELHKQLYLHRYISKIVPILCWDPRIQITAIGQQWSPWPLLIPALHLSTFLENEFVKLPSGSYIAHEEKGTAVPFRDHLDVVCRHLRWAWSFR